MTAQAHHAENDAVGAYVLGVLDEADAARFEEHLAACEPCGRRLDELTGLEPLLAALASGVPGVHGAPGRTGLTGHTPHAFTATPTAIDTLTARPSPALLGRMVGEVAAVHRKRRRRGLYLVAAAVTLIVGGPLGTVALTSGTGTDKSVTAAPSASASFARMPVKIHSTDPDTKVNAVVAIDDKEWGTDAVLRLKNVKGPFDCSLIAVAKDGHEQTMMTWSVPGWGYGIKDSTREIARAPLYARGGAALKRAEIERFEIRTAGGKRLVSVNA